MPRSPHKRQRKKKNSPSQDKGTTALLKLVFVVISGFIAFYTAGNLQNAMNNNEYSNYPTGRLLEAQSSSKLINRIEDAVFGSTQAQHEEEEEEATTTSSFTTTSTTASTTIPSFHGRPICEKTTDFFDLPALQQAMEQAHVFHTQGGNLKAVQLLLDDNIDVTVEKIGATFIPNPPETGPVPAGIRGGGGRNDDKAEFPSLAQQSRKAKQQEPPPQEKGTQQVTKYLKEYYAKYYDPRGGYGRPLPGVYNPPNHPLILQGRYVEVADPVQSRERWDASLGSIGPNCDNLLQLGATGQDGTKWYCQPKLTVRHPITATDTTNSGSVRGTTTSSKNSTTNYHHNCHIISIGGNDNWRFELEVVRQLPGCITHTFDCTLQNGQPKHKPNRDDILFYNYCIDSATHTDDHGRQYLSYFGILHKAQLQTPSVLFKIDVEGFEFDIFSDMIQKANNHTDVLDGDVSATNTNHPQQQPQKPLSWWLPQQIMVELHWATRMTGVSWMPRTRTTAEIALLSSTMYNGGGYLPIFQSWTKYCPSCMEVLYFRALC